MFLTKCDQEKYINVAWEAFKAGLFCQLTSSLLRDHLSPSVKKQLRIVLYLSFSHFWLNVTKTNNSCLTDKFPCVSNFCLLTSLLLRRGLNTWARFCLQLLAKFWWPAGWGTCGTLTCTAFRWCISWGVDLVEVGQKKDFLQKSAEKTAFLRDTNRDHLTLEGHNSLNFKDFRLSQGCFGKFGT